ncbi:MAG: sigma-70 family RNA polymerase sigma factor [Gemmataceae bacterium]
MTTARLHPVLRTIHRLDQQIEFSRLGDGDLLDRFRRDRDEAAFEELLRRHGPMVRAVCRRLLGPTADADDAFQATFLVLIRRADAVRRRALLANWLCAVAWRTARQALRHRSRLRHRELLVDRLPERGVEAEPPRDWLPLFDDALQRLPNKYREAVVLCELQGRSRADAAKLLGLNEGTLSSRLSRGRDLLRSRLARHGFPLAVGAALTVAVPEALAATTVRHAAAMVLTPAAIPNSLLSLTHGVLRTMLLNRIKPICVVMMVVTLAGGVGWRSAEPRAQPPAAEPSKRSRPMPEPPRAVDEAKPPPKNPGAPVVAMIHGQPISRDEFADFLIRRFGAQHLELFVNQRIVERACAEKGVTVTDADIDATLAADLKLLNIDRATFETTMLKKYGKSMFEWREDVLRPRLLLAKLVGPSIHIDDSDLRREFENRYGNKVDCRMIVWPASEERAAWRTFEAVHNDAAAFDRAARAQSTTTLAASGGQIPPIARYADDADAQRLADAAYALEPGEVSQPIRSGAQVVVLKRVGLVPGGVGTYESAKPELLQIVSKKKIEAEIPKLFAKLRDEAKPQLLLK